MGWMRAILKWFSSRAANDAAQAADLAKKALPVVEWIARLTPTRADDELIRLFQTIGVPAVDAWLAVPVEHRGRALFHAAAHELRRRFPGAADRIIDLAVQMAVVETKAEERI